MLDFLEAEHAASLHKRTVTSSWQTSYVEHSSQVDWMETAAERSSLDDHPNVVPRALSPISDTVPVIALGVDGTRLVPLAEWEPVRKRAYRREKRSVVCACVCGLCCLNVPRTSPTAPPPVSRRQQPAFRLSATGPRLILYDHHVSQRSL